MGNLIFIIIFYLLPTIIAVFSRKRNWLAITILNVFFGITIICWVIALIWSLTKDK